GWVAARKLVDIELPANYEFSFRIRGEAPSQTLEFKLVDCSGENVWWSVRGDFAFPHEWQTIRIKKRQISFAWGPAGGGELKRAAAIEIAIAAGTGGKGSVWISDLTLTELPPDHPYAGTPVVTASSSLPGRSPDQALTGAGGGWHSDPKASGETWVRVDFGERRELGGLVMDWDRAPRSFDVLTSADGTSWTAAWKVSTAQGGRSYVPLPETETQFLRLVFNEVPQEGVGIREIKVEPLGFAATPNDFISSVARDAPRGLYPRGFLGEMTAWTLVGTDGSRDPVGLLGTDGAFEPAPRSFAIEPFVWLDGRLITWADVTADQFLLEGYLPIPTVTWRHPAFELETTAFAEGGGDRDQTLIRYRLTSRCARNITPRLLLAIRPFQVNPPSQFLNTLGGVGRITRVARDGSLVTVDDLRVAPLSEPWSFGATVFDGGDITTFLARGGMPPAQKVIDPHGRGSAAVAYTLDLGAAGSREVWLEVGTAEVPLPKARDARRWTAEKLDLVAASWRERLDRTEIRLPGNAQDFVRATQSNLAYILMSRDGPALRPGTRSYARSWIRDGAMMAAALLRLGHAEAVRDYLLWYAPFQFPSGKVPCCVDQRGADPVAENDSNGELLFLAAEYLRFTGDRATVATVWPQVASAVSYLDQLRQQRRSEAYRAPEKLPFFGLLPESISHEGYSAKPMHSYWDDFWALKGLTDAVWLADTLGHPEEAAAWTAMRDEFKKDLLASIAWVREAKKVAYIPGCAELGDFDATSTTVALWPAGADADLSRETLEATFERYWREVEARFTGKVSWDAYTPYEWRSVGAFVRLGWRDRAARLASWLMADRHPAGWNQWSEVVHHDRTKAAFLGDLPHAWVGSDFIRSFLDMLAYERGRDGALVLAAGVAHEWLAGSGLAVRGLRTPHGTLSCEMRAEGDAIYVRIEPGLSVPPGGIVLAVPVAGPVGTVTINGKQAALSAGGEVVVRQCPAEVVIRPQGAPPVGGRVPEDMGNQ
ncbi:MAG TPA: discoidin domain-containing protein, partial [Thermoanaerobaculaceae bacterium]|nr:discoidin domain-containing protein [Thermoanaerobaculaceae bacterium]